MLQRIRKLSTLLRWQSKYPQVITYGCTRFASFFVSNSRPLKNGFFSQLGQDELVFTEFFEALTAPGISKRFVDVGCNDPVLHSNSYFFEANQGYSVLAVDALKEVRDRWKERRPTAEFVECAVGRTSGELSFDVVEGPVVESMFSSVSGASKKLPSGTVTKRKVQVKSLREIFAERNLCRAEIVSMDIEGYELEALLGIDFSVFSANIFIIENNGYDGLGSDEIRDLLISHGYTYFARIWNLDDIFVHPRVLASRRPLQESE